MRLHLAPALVVPLHCRLVVLAGAAEGEEVLVLCGVTLWRCVDVPDPGLHTEHAV